MYKIVSGSSLFDMIMSDSKITDLPVTYIKDGTENVITINIFDSLNNLVGLIPELSGYRLSKYERLIWINKAFLPLLSDERIFEDAVYFSLVYTIEGDEAAMEVCSPELRRLVVEFAKISLEAYENIIDKAVGDFVNSLLEG